MPYTPCGKALSDSILALFRLNNELLLAGDQLVADLGLTSARWKVLGTIAQSPPQPVAWLARQLGMNRQNVQRLVNDLLAAEFVQLVANPNHRRAPYVVLSAAGQSAYESAMQRQTPWVNGLAEGLSLRDIEAMQRVLKHVSERLTR